jgi:hypothetical protein
MSTNSAVTPRALLAIAVLLAALVLLAGCGGGGGTETTSKAQVIKTGDAACAKADNEKKAAFVAYAKEHPTATESTGARRELMLEVELPPIEEELSALQGLEPESSSAEYKALVSALETGIDEAEAEPLALLKAATSPLAKADRLAKAYGFQVCSSFE